MFGGARVGAPQAGPAWLLTSLFSRGMGKFSSIAMMGK